MRKQSKFIYLFLLFQALFWPIAAAAQSAEDLMRNAKLAIFDQRWEDALRTLRELQSRHPRSSTTPQSLFYEARVLENLGEDERALKTYETFVEHSSQDSTLAKEARSSIVQLSARLYRAGSTQYIDRAIAALNSPDQALRFLTAVELSYITNPAISREAIPILQVARHKGQNTEIQNQAALALLRIDPKLLEAGEKSGTSDKTGMTLSIAIISEGEESFKLSFPLSLARMLFSALPDDAKEDLKKEGLNPENILRELETADQIIEVRTSDNEIFRLWVE